MKNLEKNVKNAWGDRGSEWLRELPLMIQKLVQHWSLSNIQPVANMSWNYVAYAMQNHSNPIVLKISCDPHIIQDEYRALKHFDGKGAIKVLDIHHEYNAMLLEQAIPGFLLKEHYPFNLKETIKVYCQVIKGISTRNLTDFSCAHVSKWCEVINKMQGAKINNALIEKAKQLRSALLSSAKNEYLCHGDLHMENIIQHGSRWVAIDPKGIIGEIAFEAAAFDLLSKNEMDDTENIPYKIIDRVTLLANELGVDFDRLLSWIYLRIMISAQWFIEDGGDPSHMLELANYIYPLLKVDV